MDEVIAAVARGELTPDEAEKITGMLGQRLKAAETIDLARELAELRALAAASLPQLQVTQAAVQEAVPVWAVPIPAAQP